MHALSLHPSCKPGPVVAVHADIRATDEGCEAEFALRGAIADIILPEPARALRTDNLWKTTCFEIFWQPQGVPAYREFNLSPSGRWAAYDFDAFREGMRDAPVDAIALGLEHGERDGEGELRLTATIVAELPTPARVALNAIVEHRDGALQYWALAFAPGKAEFHSETCRQITAEKP